MTGIIVDGNDVEAVYANAFEAVERARSDGGPTLIEVKTMRMLGHAIHDGAEYVPPELLAEWEARDPLRLFEAKLLAEPVADQAELDEIGQRCKIEVEDAIAYAEASPWPAANRVSEGVYAN
jgi:pyruvate dehydrogenase E1 component alpha subunit